jgi:hypothetical protein
MAIEPRREQPDTVRPTGQERTDEAAGQAAVASEGRVKPHPERDGWELVPGRTAGAYYRKVR